MALRPEPAAGVVNLLSDEEGGEAQAAGPTGLRESRPRRVKLQQPPPPPPPPAPPRQPPHSPFSGLAELADEAALDERRDRDRGLVRFENKKLFSEFVEFCGSLTEENPEVINFLQRKYSKAFPDYLASTEFRNVLGRCLTRVQGKKSKVFVYINELCTALKANSQKTKLALTNRDNSKQPLAAGPEGQSTQDVKEQNDCSERTSAQSGDVASTSVTQATAIATAKKKHIGSGSRRQIRYLENLLKVYADEIKRLQEKELDLNELQDEDSSYIQEHRLKKKMVKIFEKLCELKSCSSLTGRVIEQRIAFTGTRYPEINRKIERFINKPDHFPDYQDIRNIMQKVSVKHSLGLSQRQIQSMAQDVFREVGNRLQERRHLDLVYNFGSHLTDDYKPGKDPAMTDITLEKRLRSNRSIALGRLDEVVRKYAEIQDVGEIEEEEKRKKKKKLLQSAVTSTSEASKANAEGVKEQQEKLLKVDESKGKEPEEEEMEEEDARDSEEEEEEEDDEEDLSSDPDIEEELSKIEEVVEAEEEPQEDEKAEGTDGEEVDESEESAQSSDVESEEDAESGEGEVEGGVGLDAAGEDVSSNNESSPVCTTHEGSECNDESGSTAPAKVGGDDGTSPVCTVEEGVGLSIEGRAVPAVEEGIGSSSEKGDAEERVGSSSENRAATPMVEGVGSDNVRSPACVTGEGDHSDIEDSPARSAEEEIGSDEASPPPTDHEGMKGELGEQAVRRPKRKRADSSGQKLEAPTAKPNPKTASEALEDLSTGEETITNNLSAHDKCNAETSPCYEPKSLSTGDDSNLDRRPVIKKENLDMLETDGHSPDIYLTAVNGEKKGSVDLDSPPVAKRVKRGQDMEMQSSVEVIELMESDEGMEEPLMDHTESGVGVKSPLPAVDSTRADSPLVSVVTSSQPSPVNVATQCDPEEIIVLSDSD
ncbi:death domain-associated protein 6 isoform X2 [Carcharodon carcharias]|uniref:death domain-associated protein 6 isoform X2 n=1 Tax=Carcharodon carcharias TaxID=13397 RepID=UPI001B7E2BA5|nr:death domain-associated protein 6 isoform X2 [Carcharodon carcharias]